MILKKLSQESVTDFQSRPFIWLEHLKRLLKKQVLMFDNYQTLRQAQGERVKEPARGEPVEPF